MLLWSDGYMHLAKQAVSKYLRLLKQRSVKLRRNSDVAARIVSCQVDGCYSFATELLDAEQHLINVPPRWRFIGEVEFDRRLQLVTVCPMCEKHARRFRRTLNERVLRLEARLDELHDDVYRIEDEDEQCD